MPDTTQTIIIDTYDQSGAGSITFALLDSTVDRAAVSVDSITHAFASGSNNTIVVTLTNATVIPAGDYFLQVTIDGVAGFVWVALAGVADEVVEATAERNVLMQGIADKLTTERLAKIDGAMQAGGEGFTGETLSEQIAVIEGGVELTLSDGDKQELITEITNGVTAVSPRIISAVQHKYLWNAGDSWDQSFSLAATDATRVLVVIKRRITDSDDNAIVLCDNIDGLLRLNGAAAATPGNAEVTFSPVEVRFKMKSADSLLVPAGVYHLFVKYLSADVDATPEYKAELTVNAAGSSAVTT
jgi:hypothetical protein